MTDTASAHGGDTDSGDNNGHSALRARVRALGPKAIADLSRRTKGREHVSHAQIRLFRDGLAALDAKATAAVADAVTAIEAAGGRRGNVVRFPAAEKAKAARRPKAARKAKFAKPPGATEERNTAIATATAEAGDDHAAALIARAAAVSREAANVLIAEAARLPMNGVESGRFARTLAKALDVAPGDVKKEIECARRAASAAASPSAEAVAAAEAEVRKVDRASLEPRVRSLSLRADLLSHIGKVAARMGVVGEEHAVCAVYLAASSRLLRYDALRLLRRGSSATGKNFVCEKVLDLFPPQSVIRTAGGSDKALPYYGGAANKNSLKHKVIYIPEAVFIANKGGVEKEFTSMLRTLMSEGVLRYMRAPNGESGTDEAIVIEKDGPIVAITTSARDNVEAELLTRLVVADADESSAQTSRIMTATFAAAKTGRPSRAGAEAEIAELVDFQHWLELGGPYEVAIPFADALRAAYGPSPAEHRVRRDISAVIAAISTSAVLHQAQRQRDPEGRIVAELADYEGAFRALNVGLASLYEPQTSAPARRLVRVLEDKLAAKRAAEAKARAKSKPDALDPWDGGTADTVSATMREIGKALGHSSPGSTYDLIRSAIGGRLIEDVTERDAPRAAPRRYRVLAPSATLAATVKTVEALPQPDKVKALLADPTALADALAAVGVAEGEADARDFVPAETVATGPSAPPRPVFDDDGISSCRRRAGASLRASA
jgi:hypothetical protein